MVSCLQVVSRSVHREVHCTLLETSMSSIRLGLERIRECWIIEFRKLVSLTLSLVAPTSLDQLKPVPTTSRNQLERALTNSHNQLEPVINDNQLDLVLFNHANPLPVLTNLHSRSQEVLTNSHRWSGLCLTNIHRILTSNSHQ